MRYEIKKIVFASQLSWVLALLCALLPLFSELDQVEMRSHDLRFVRRNDRSSPSKIVLVTIDAKTSELWTEPTPAWGEHLAELIRHAVENGARVVALDYILAYQTDEYLWSKIAVALRRVGVSPQRMAQLESDIIAIPSLQPNAAMANALEKYADRVVLSNDLSDSLIRDFQIIEGVQIGNVVPTAQVDSALRTMSWKVSELPSFPVAITNSALAHASPSKRLQQEKGETFWINYVSATPGHAFRTIPAYILARGNLTPAQKSLLKDAILIVGTDFRGSNDYHNGIASQEFAGYEINAHATATLLDNAILHRVSKQGEMFVSVLAGLCAVALALSCSFWVGLVGILGLGIAWLLGGQWAFQTQNLLIPYTAPLVALSGCWMFAQLQRALLERRQKRYVEAVFGNYLTPGLRDYLLSSPENLALGGRVGEATIMVVDLRGFTAYAQKRKPEYVMSVLNGLFQELVPLVQKHQGLILHYTGDGFIALFGQPKPDADHARHAIHSAQEIARRAQTWQQSESEDLNVWSVGCSLASGELAYGNLGAKERPDFTVIGNVINLASRLQEVCKEFKTAIVADGACYLAAGSPTATSTHSREIRGLDEPIDIYIVEY